jgi:hypothetical protein
MGSPERKESRVVSARVIKWDEHHFGIAIAYADDQHAACVVGTREQALAEAVEIRAGKPMAARWRATHGSGQPRAEVAPIFAKCGQNLSGRVRPYKIGPLHCCD